MIAEPAELLAGLDPEQQQVATSFGQPVVVIAGAGTGKTRALTHRIAYGVATGAYDAAAVLAVTFTTRAAGELRSPAARARACRRCRPAPSTPRRCARRSTSGRARTAARCPEVSDERFSDGGRRGTPPAAQPGQQHPA